ncbi:hypothetical protein [Sphingobacterium sp. 1.A.5]|uniref:hypothetical protein n=1 Tax=Sphingobacterium sp. 1.A.5 TaxID=2044604 RepID=UPI000C0BEA7F|nr:hypothetical protein [Sphingobacterium sp. 1.A.5]
MRGKVIVSKFWTKFFSLGKAQAITIFPFIFLKYHNDKINKILINHERIHILQAIELLILPFYILYLTEFMVRLIQYRNFTRAYLNISFEREAYENENNLDYLKTRKLYSFLKYVTRKG